MSSPQWSLSSLVHQRLFQNSVVFQVYRKSAIVIGKASAVAQDYPGLSVLTATLVEIGNEAAHLSRPTKVRSKRLSVLDRETKGGGVSPEPKFCFRKSQIFGRIALSDEYANGIPNPKHMPKYTKAKVPHTQDKHTSAEQLCRALLLLLPPYKKPCCCSASQSMLTHTHYQLATCALKNSTSAVIIEFGQFKHQNVNSNVSFAMLHCNVKLPILMFECYISEPLKCYGQENSRVITV